MASFPGMHLILSETDSLSCAHSPSRVDRYIQHSGSCLCIRTGGKQIFSPHLQPFSPCKFANVGMPVSCLGVYAHR